MSFSAAFFKNSLRRSSMLIISKSAYQTDYKFCNESILLENPKEFEDLKEDILQFKFSIVLSRKHLLRF